MSQISFQIFYGTHPNEYLRLHFQTSRSQTGYVSLHSADRYRWTGEVEIEPGVEWIAHEYEVMRGNDVVRREDEAYRCIYIEKRSQILLLDSWTEHGIPPVFRHTAFTHCVFSPEGGVKCQGILGGRYLLLLNALPAPAGFRWGISGSCDSLGGWDPQRAQPLIRTGVYEWACPLRAEDFSGHREYKILLLNDAAPERPLWESGENRVIPSLEDFDSSYGAFVSISGPRFNIPEWRGAGVVMPVSALRSRGSQGIGDFGDLYHFVDWVADCGMHAVQLLPLYDTTRTGDSNEACPYDIVSAFAMNPVFLDLREWKDEDFAQPFLEEGARLNTAERLDYTTAVMLKERFMRELFRHEGRRILHSDAFKRFSAESRGWLDPYAQWKAQNTKPLLSRTTSEGCAAPHGEGQEGLGYISFQQFLLHRQLLAVHEHARSRCVMLKGDFPMGVSTNSVTMWKTPELFHKDTQTGAPPDDFSPTGQNWAFPTYDWETMAQNGYLWWRRRLMHASQYFDAYRLDHALGFFRIWEIPGNQRYGVMGHFRPTHPLSGPEITAAGFHLPVWLYTRPHLSARSYARLKEKAGGTHLERYFQKEGGYFTLRPEVADGRGIEQHVQDPLERKLLMDLVTDVLFLEDPDYAGCYHPRIAARHTEVYKTLPPDAQSAFDSMERDFFYVRHEGYWAEEAEKKLKAILSYHSDTTLGAAAHSMLPCAEDLGMAPACTFEVLQKLGILSLKVQTLPVAWYQNAEVGQYKNPTGDVHPVGDGALPYGWSAFTDDGMRTGRGVFSGNPYLSVDTPSTHDMATIRQCWSLDHEGARACWTRTLSQDGDVPEDATAESCREILKCHFESPSIWCLVSLQDLLSMDATLRNPHLQAERINDPAGPSEELPETYANWTWRMHLNIEDLYAAVDFNERLHNLLRLTGRNA